MKKYIFLILSLFLAINAFAVPDSLMTVSPSASDGAVIQAADENTRNNAISATYNAHSHEDFTSLPNLATIGTIISGTWNGTTIGVAYGGTGSTTASGARTALGLAIGSDVQAYDAQLADVAGLTTTDNGVIIGNGSNFVVESGATLKTSLGLTIGTDVQAYDAQLADLADGSLSGAGTCDTSALTGTTYVPDNTVDTTALKDASAELTWNNGTQGISTMTGGAYCFYPQTKLAAETSTASFRVSVQYNYEMSAYTVPATYGTYICYYNSSGQTGYAQATYITASGEDYWLFILIDKSNKEVLSMSGAPDHPAYGNSNNFEEQPHPFMSFDKVTQDIILIEKIQAKEIQQEAKDKGMSVLELVENNYRIDFSQVYPYIPIHSGQFSPEHQPVLVQAIPDYIQVRKLVPLTVADKAEKITLQEQRKNELKNKQAQEELRKQNLLNKLGITEEDFKLLLK